MICQRRSTHSLLTVRTTGLYFTFVCRIFASPASCKFLKRYLDEINLHGLPGILQGVKLMTDHNNAFLQDCKLHFLTKKSKVKVQIGKFRDPENEDSYCSHDYRRFVYNFGSVSNFLAARLM